ncbi:MAG TPA: CHASE3 domain-containing protein [Ohtaekwangia sp.]|nr:CHASE3 domain-containing protein [Ohtaekwangia sp.]
MTAYFQRKVWIGFIAAMALIAWLALASYWQNKKFEETSAWVAHTNRVLFHTEQLVSLTIDIESGQRGFALTSKEEFLEPYYAASASVLDHIERIKELTRDNVSQQIRIRKLETLLNKKLLFAENVINITRRDNLEEARAVNASMVGKRITDQVRLLINEIQKEENDLLVERTALTEKRVQRFYSTFTALLSVTGIILLLIFYAIYINLKRRTKAEVALRKAIEQVKDMYDNAPCGYHSLNNEGVFVEMNRTWLQWLQYKHEEVVNKMKFRDILTPEGAAMFQEKFDQMKRESFIHDLEFEIVRKDGAIFSVLLNAIAIYDVNGNFVQTRSTVIDYTTQRSALNKVELLNKELESFSYSVSHDLRAPLRSIDGYTQILIEDYAPKMDAEGNRLLQVVVNNARRMTRLIDDLLDFSRVGRKEIDKTTVQVNSLVSTVITEVKAMEPADREIEFVVHPLEPCMADPNLLRQVWYNLISNAVKYTRKTPHARITISSIRHAEELEYSISDNGTGFDMAYAHKLFGVFQRLHRQQEFEGTGVGLAIVHRIITRHGGSIRAQGKVNEGAEFHFSLPLKG